jgi:hypothetical protein
VGSEEIGALVDVLVGALVDESVEHVTTLSHLQVVVPELQ